MRYALKVQSRPWSNLFPIRSKAKHAATVADRRLALRLQAALERVTLTEVEHLSFYVREGHVTVYGLVFSEADRTFIIDVVKRVPGVNSAHAHMQVVAPEAVQETRL